MMERGKPTLVPEWYRGSTGSASASGNSNHHSRSSLRSDRSLSSFRRSATSNSSMTHDRVIPSDLRSYNSFGRSHRDKDREKDHNLYERSRSLLVENGFSNYTDSVTGSRNERDALRRTPSLVARQGEALSKRPSSDLSNGITAGPSTIHSIGKHSFVGEFPSLGVEERQPDIARVSSPGLTTAMDNLSRISSVAIGGDGWTSALAEVPVRVGGSGPTALSSSTGLNMAETLAQGPLHARTASQVSVDSQKIEEFTRLQYSKLVPMKPSVPKSLALNSLEKSKVKGARSGEYSGPSKIGLQSSSQLAGHTFHSPARSDAVKMSQAGNLQVLNWEKNGITPILRDGLNLRNASKVVATHDGAPTVVTPPKSPVAPKPKLDNISGFSSSTQSHCAEKRPKSQAQNRNDFFNIIRQKAPPNRTLDPPEVRSVSQEKERPALCTGLECLTESENGATGDNNVASEGLNRFILNGEDETSPSDPVIAIFIPDTGKESSSSDPLLNCDSDVGDETLSSGPAVVSRTISPANSGDVVSSPDSRIADSILENVDEISSSDPVAAPSEEEVAFLRRLGWDENADGDALTPEEIAYFYQKHPEQKRMVLPVSGQTG